jgi:hypothetical protein
LREADVTGAASQHFVREFERAGANALVVDGERRCRLDVRPDSNRGARRGRPDGLVVGRRGVTTTVIAIESKARSGLASLLPLRSPLLAPGSRTGSAMEQAASYPADFRVLALACDIFEEAPELESHVRSEALRLGIGLIVVHGRDFVDLLVAACAHPCTEGDWLGAYDRGEELRARLSQVG